MKITMRDLDSTILEKLQILDGVVNSYDESNPDGFVSYGPNGFFFKKTNDTFLKKVFTEDEIVDLEKALYENRKNVLSSANSDFRIGNSFNKATQKFLYKINTELQEFDSVIAKIEIFDDDILVLLENGKLISLKKDFEINIIELLKTNFSLSADMGVYSIIKIIELSADELIIVTDDFGIYKLGKLNKEVELLISLKSVKDACLTSINTLFVASDEFCAQYDLKTSLRTEKYNNILNQRQVPNKIIQTQNDIFIQAVPAGIFTNENLIHVWSLDDARLAYNCKDKYLPKLPIDKNYQIMFSSKVGENLYFSGKIQEKIFVWKFNLENYDFEEEIIDCVDTVQFNGFIAFGDLKIFLIGKKLFIINNNEIIENLLISQPSCRTLFLFENELYTISKNKFVKLILPKFESKSETLSYEIYNKDEPCNNIDIFVKGGTRNERINLIDMETNKEIPSSYYVVYGSNSIIKLMNCSSRKIKMIISVNANSSIEGIVVKNNRMFLR